MMERFHSAGIFCLSDLVWDLEISISDLYWKQEVLSLIRFAAITRILKEK